jgi:hypothetical protein
MAARKRRKKRTSNPTVYDSAGKLFTKAKRTAAKIIARAIGGTVGKPKKSKNPLPVGRMVKVKARRLRNGKVQIFRA